MPQTLNRLVLLFLISAVLGPAISYGKLYLFHICLVVMLAAVVFYRRTLPPLNGENLKLNSRWHWLLYLMWLWYGLSAFWSQDIHGTGQYMVVISLGLSLVLTVLYYGRDAQRLETIFKVLQWVFLIEIGFGLLEAITPYHLPVSAHSPLSEYLGRPAFWFIPDPYAPTGFHWNANDFALVLVLLFPFILLHKQWAVRIIGSLLILFLLFQGQARGALLGLAAIVVAYLLIINRQRLRNFILLLFMAGIGLGVNSALQGHQHRWAIMYTETISGVHSYVDPSVPSLHRSTTIRRTLLKNGWDALLETKGLGIGGGATHLMQEFRRTPELEHVRTMHNFWFEILVEAGVVFFILFVTWFIALNMKLYRLGLNSTDPLLQYRAKALALSYSGFAVACISLSTAIYFLPMWLMFGLGIALINKQKLS